jgi:hypothetical protein
MNRFDFETISQKGTFLWTLHEENTFDTEKAAIFYKIIIEEIERFEKVGRNSGEYDDFLSALYRAVAYFSRCICSHLDTEDLFEMSQFPSNYSDYTDRFDFLMEKAIRCSTVGIASYFDELGGFFE